MEVQARKSSLISVEELWWTATDDAIERGDALLAVQEKLNDARRKLLVSLMCGRLRFRGPYEKATNRKPAVRSTRPNIACPEEDGSHLKLAGCRLR